MFLAQSNHMDDWRSDRATAGYGRGVVIDTGIDEVLDEVRREGFALVRKSLPPRECSRLLAEADAACGRFLRVPSRVNGVNQRGDQLSMRVGDPRCPAVNALAASLGDAMRSSSEDFGLGRFDPTEARYMRYRGRAGGLGPHRDGKCYGLVVAVYSLSGSAPFTVLPDGTEPTVRLCVEPGDLLLLRAPGFAGLPDGRRRHAVGAPLTGERVSLTMRMVGQRGHRRPDRWSRAG